MPDAETWAKTLITSLILGAALSLCAAATVNRYAVQGFFLALTALALAAVGVSAIALVWLA